jgi:hypothetical protein
MACNRDIFIFTSKIIDTILIKQLVTYEKSTVVRARFRLDEALSYLRYGALYKSRYSMSVTNTIFGYLEG